MLITAIVGFFFNLIQMNILHGGFDGHYHVEGEEEHGHAHSHHGHHHGHDHGHSHSHSHAKVDNEAAKCDDEFHGDKKTVRNINVEAAFLHVLGDLVMSIGVVISSVIIMIEPTWTLADPLCTYLFSVIVCVTTFPTIKTCMTVLIEAAPSYIDPVEVKEAMLAIEEV
jgi:zinc transporter 2